MLAFFSSRLVLLAYLCGWIDSRRRSPEVCSICAMRTSASQILDVCMHSLDASILSCTCVAQPVPLSCGLKSMSGHLLKEYASGTWIAPLCFGFIMLIIILAKLAPRWTWVWCDPPRSPTSPSNSGSSRRGTGVLGRLGNVTCVFFFLAPSLVFFALGSNAGKFFFFFEH
ncbi:hypothetical protein C8R43DRAFT_642090 [Mycena crocata]|nr:hypothetical protein C8R43DRAFT_642090 [Mycena crocata]